eukprot:COSAG04_NODE_2539_length_3956_cov_4.847031_2_plen_243_part_00
MSRDYILYEYNQVALLLGGRFSPVFRRFFSVFSLFSPSLRESQNRHQMTGENREKTGGKWARSYGQESLHSRTTPLSRDVSSGRRRLAARFPGRLPRSLLVRCCCVLPMPLARDFRRTCAHAILMPCDFHMQKSQGAGPKEQPRSERSDSALCSQRSGSAPLRTGRSLRRTSASSCRCACLQPVDQPLQGPRRAGWKAALRAFASQQVPISTAPRPGVPRLTKPRTGTALRSAVTRIQPSVI